MTASRISTPTQKPQHSFTRRVLRQFHATMKRCHDIQTAVDHYI